MRAKFLEALSIYFGILFLLLSMGVDVSVVDCLKCDHEETPVQMAQNAQDDCCEEEKSCANSCTETTCTEKLSIHFKTKAFLQNSRQELAEIGTRIQHQFQQAFQNIQIVTANFFEHLAADIGEQFKYKLLQVFLL